MKKPDDIKSKVSLSLTGILSQFSIALLFILAAIIALFYILIKYCDKNIYLLISGSILLGAIMTSSIICAFVFYLRQQNRPSQDVPSGLELKSSDGRQVKFINPPDKVFSKEEVNEIMRFLTVSYDEKMCPSGEVIGHASNNKYRQFTDEEKEEFKKKHINEIRGKKNAVLDMYNQPQFIIDSNSNS